MKPETNAHHSYNSYIHQLKISEIMSYLQSLDIPFSYRSKILYNKFKLLKLTEVSPIQAYNEFLRLIAHETKDQHWCAKAGIAAPYHSYSPISEIFMSAKTLHAALIELNQYTDLFQGKTHTNIVIENKKVLINYEVSIFKPEYYKFDIEYSLFRLVSQIRERLGKDWIPDTFYFQYALSRKDKDNLKKIIPTHYEDNAKFNGISFDEEWLNAGINKKEHDETFIFFLKNHLNKLKHSSCMPESMSMKVQDIMYQHILSQKDISLSWVAAKLYISPRTLQRKLAKENINYSDILDKIRCDISIDKLVEEKIRIDSLAELLGYTDSAAFSKAFKRWTGSPPLQYIKKQGYHKA
ncbi:AraC family transcriptional regulator ligand-binding domain-containing protein [Providencia thailandensis]|uniref:AraC family transcriptional regulator ligand-binding domain-containing protein n=1 Tax=Providencia stuartii TaxID=588 RepID=A0AAJ1JJH1_PROST|nr:AraC family transcriptional regulator [Providencia thailandensis]MDE8751646.1 AraC family transcriptional regulator ligand-binding domain-containing protein [Providencia thailandensis]MDE8770694.1 AraC family transcriptional regulator ligand-binding domain-containing protein [Providencia thailandensis]MDE8775045.1 AraC family transcriptional regulator ligand-binding domain-containing protein [Providencia thailandensis]MDE8791254.1 AraC family transcriptional regulator ligand-binding domain-c